MSGEPSTDVGGRAGRRWPLVLLVAAAIPAIFWQLGEGPIYRSMEGREALVIREMVRDAPR